MKGGEEVASAVLTFTIIGWAFGCIGVRHCRRSFGRSVGGSGFWFYDNFFLWRIVDIYRARRTHFWQNGVDIYNPTCTVPVLRRELISIIIIVQYRGVLGKDIRINQIKNIKSENFHRNIEISLSIRSVQIGCCTDRPPHSSVLA